MKLGIYPGSFDPLTNGHIDIIERSRKFIDNLIIGISDNNNKKNLFNLDERIKMINTIMQNRNINNVTVESFNGLLVSFVKKKKANLIIRGLRAVSDFEYEFQMTGMNFKLNSSIETIFLMASDNNQLISSNLVKEVSKLNGDVSKFVPPEVQIELKKKFK
ncbi:MAG: Phosphopantetheine adenylyltransferase [Alphaproteobacteria bacterium MarineAlpha6_Bin2]|nr:MAG: Phosphopantetheine adenylyltransferase [Alphaproteobacteria bacterium MarineAlpha6_Bin2]